MSNRQKKNGTNQPTWILYVDYFDNSDDSKKKTRCDTFFFLENDSTKGEQIYKWKTHPSLSSSISKIKGNIQDRLLSHTRVLVNY